MIKNFDEIEKMREACFIAAFVLDELVKAVKPGMSTYELDQLGKVLIEKQGAESACYHYRHNKKIFPGYICVSVNEEVVHGIGSSKRILMSGDLVSIDVSVRYNGFIGDTARTVAIGELNELNQRLLQVTEEALFLGINQARAHNKVGDISHAVQSYVESNQFSVVREFVGHGIGRSIHEEPQIPNFGLPKMGAKLYSGMTIAIEPMVNLGKSAVEYAADGWTVLTKDRSPSAHFEHTILIQDGEPEILTLLKNVKK
jgi:methionyl aminopeptidase